MKQGSVMINRKEVQTDGRTDIFRYLFRLLILTLIRKFPETLLGYNISATYWPHPICNFGVSPKWHLTFFDKYVSNYVVHDFVRKLCLILSYLCK